MKKLLLLALLIVGCDKSMTKSDEISDDQLMQDIINNVQVDCNMSDLPANAIYVIEEEYNEYAGRLDLQDKEMSQRAKEMCDRITRLRKKYNCS